MWFPNYTESKLPFCKITVFISPNRTIRLTCRQARLTPNLHNRTKRNHYWPWYSTVHILQHYLENTYLPPQVGKSCRQQLKQNRSTSLPHIITAISICRIASGNSLVMNNILHLLAEYDLTSAELRYLFGAVYCKVQPITSSSAKFTILQATASITFCTSQNN